MALTDADRIQLTTMALMRHNVISKGSAISSGSNGVPMIAIVTNITNIREGMVSDCRLISPITGMVSDILTYEDYI